MYTNLNFTVDLMSRDLAVMLSRKKKPVLRKGWRILIQNFAISSHRVDPWLDPRLISGFDL